MILSGNLVLTAETISPIQTFGDDKQFYKNLIC
jgi:hypothetical protein